MNTCFVTLVLISLAAYLVGSLSFAVLVSRAFGLPDPRHYGSHNPGATNVLRSGRKGAAALTLCLDALKGWLPVFILGHWGLEVFPAWGQANLALAQACVALAVLAGHLYPVFFGFRGGKGVATAGGILFGIHPLLGLAVVLTWVLVAVLTRYSSLAALLSALAAPVYYGYGGGGLGQEGAGHWQAQPVLELAVVLMSATLLWRHRANLGRLWRGQEAQLGEACGGYQRN